MLHAHPGKIRLMNQMTIPEIPQAEQTPTVKLLLDIIAQQKVIIHRLSEEVGTLKEEVGALKEEVRRLKKHKGKPRIKPSQMNKNGSGSNSPPGSGKRAGSEKRNKNSELIIHEEKIIPANNVPEGSRRRGYQDYVVQDLVIHTKNTRYRLERWELPDGSYCVASLPADIAGYHFGPVLRSFVDYQYHHQHVTQPLLLEQLRDYGVDISSGALNNLLTENKEAFHHEKTGILPAGLAVARCIHVDDTGARHQGKNGYCTHIGNELFAWFESTGSKSRINFLELLQMGKQKYLVSQDALDYMKNQKLPINPMRALEQASIREFETKDSFEKHLNDLQISAPRHRKIATEGALIGAVLSGGFFVNTTIMSDDAGQFNIFRHILCWIHAERKINEPIPFHEGHTKDIAHIRSLFWEIYGLLKEYKQVPDDSKKMSIKEKFDAMCAIKTSYQLLNNVLKRLKNNKDELLLVLEHPELPLHNNLSERDIREYVKKRKISGGTRSPNGRRCRDTFASLKKTCRKLKINFWDYLIDRHKKAFSIPQIPDLIAQAAGATTS